MMDTRYDNKRRLVMDEIQRRGLNIVQQGKSWRIYGMNVDILTCDIAHLDPDSLKPFMPRKGYGMRTEPMSQ